MESRITFHSQNYLIEGLFNVGGKSKGVVVTHPHPMYGGNMYNPVVETIVKAYRQKGYATLRFNFRGVDQSEGQFDNGVGEQDDVKSALKFLSASGTSQIDLVGYSFGAWVNAHLTSDDLPPQSMVMVSPPLGFIDFPASHGLDSLRLVITGSRDEIAPASAIKKMLPQWNQKAYIEIIQEADHFYGGYLDKLEAVLSRFI